MKRKMLLVAVICAAALSGLGNVVSISEHSEPGALSPPAPEREASSGCAEDEPPSGIYTDIVFMQEYDYDCTTGVLTLQGSALTSCTTVDDLAGGKKPIKGACAVANPVSGSTTMHYGLLYAALVGTYDRFDFYTHGHGENRKCIESSKTPLIKSGVTYINENMGSCGWSPCDPQYFAAHATGVGPLGSITFGHNGNTYRCY